MFEDFSLQAVNRTAEGFRSARSSLDGLGKDEPETDMQSMPLTTLSMSPFERREGDDKQVRPKLSVYHSHCFSH